ncbi:hypothetical protein E2C01_008298 [Portunus trituberculatus]|uniref:C2H2-type domain-containing protein n=1 Tax=Portunus trituberculatus TaxID=210409 RepID=A0A5B7D2F5_PORTR|nr:hypothetical protein [Portunus trituberculatus]
MPEAPRPHNSPLGGDAEDFLCRLEDRNQEARLPPPPSGFPAFLHPNTGNFTSSVVLTPAAATFPSQHMYNTSTTTSMAQHPDAVSPSLFCPSCPFVTRNVRQLVTHRHVAHMETSQPHWSTSLKQPPPLSRVLSAEEKDQRVFKCPYCDVKEKGREAIKNHVITHSLGEEGPDRLYWCSFCTLKCRSAPGLASHMKRHEVQGDC